MELNSQVKNLLNKYNYKIPSGEDQLEDLVEKLQDDFINIGIDENEQVNEKGKDLDYLIDYLLELLEE